MANLPETRFEIRQQWVENPVDLLINMCEQLRDVSAELNRIKDLLSRVSDSFADDDDYYGSGG